MMEDKYPEVPVATTYNERLNNLIQEIKGRQTNLVDDVNSFADRMVGNGIAEKAGASTLKSVSPAAMMDWLLDELRTIMSQTKDLEQAFQRLRVIG